MKCISYLGDGVLAYFGYPSADKHDAERAVRAGLALVEAVGLLDTTAGHLCKCGLGSLPRWWWSAT
jgi:class 3 adenylate cyclase